MPYSDKNGVMLKHHTEEQIQSGDVPGDPEIDEQAAQLEELYFDKRTGHLTVAVDTQTDGYIRLNIPILPTESWNEFFDSLPTWTR